MILVTPTLTSEVVHLIDDDMHFTTYKVNEGLSIE